MTQSFLLLIRVTLVTLLLFPLGLKAVNKADNTTNLNQSASWSGSAPDQFGIAQWTNAFSATSAATPLSLGGNVTWGGITILNPGGDVTITTGNTLTLSASGINMSGATQNLTIRSGLTLLSGSNQTWNVAAGRTLNLSDGTFTRGTGAVLNILGSGIVTATKSTT